MPAIERHKTQTTGAGQWDGPGEVARADGEAQLRHMHAWWEGDQPGLADSYRFPHHPAADGSPADPDAVRFELARLTRSNIPAADKAGVEAHLNAHLIDAGAGGQRTFARPGEARAHAYEGDRRAPTAERGRMQPFRGYFERSSVLVNNKSMEQLDGYASVTGVEYEMWDMFGEYGETIDARAFDVTLSQNPDVAFLLNHRGMTMARTTNGTLALDADPRGLHSLAYVNPDRTDVRDLLIAIDDKNVTEMSFAFMLLDGEWDESYEHFTILQVDLDRGDVSAVNYGANPYTNIGERSGGTPYSSVMARAGQVLDDLAHLPAPAQRAAYQRLAAQFGDELRIDASPQAQRAAAAIAADVIPNPAGRTDVVRAARTLDVSYVSQMLRLDQIGDD
jgi:hypothetical protein